MEGRYGLDSYGLGKESLERTRFRWEDNMKVDRKETGREGMDWIYVAQDRDQCRVLVVTVMAFRVLRKENDFLTA
jgi:hypothetical protein